MKKNLIIISLIFALPLIAYAVLSGTKVESATQEHVSGKPQIIKFSSKLCSDCKKMKGVFETVMPQYSGTVEVIEYDIEKNDKNINNAIDTYNVNLVPTVVYIDKNGKVVRKTEGYVDKHKFEAYVKEILN
jgi:thioredoxin-related protein